MLGLRRRVRIGRPKLRLVLRLFQRRDRVLVVVVRVELLRGDEARRFRECQALVERREGGDERDPYDDAPDFE